MAFSPPAAQPLYGGDARAWVGPQGNIEDQGYCHARLKLPLAEKPAWEYEYTSAQFSGLWPNVILNYDGRLAVCAQSPQLMVMEAASGKVLLNKDVYQRDLENTQQELFTNMYLTPRGRLLATDNINSLYCFDLASLSRVWRLAPRPRAFAGAVSMVADDEKAYMPWGLPDTYNAHSVELASGKPGWTSMIAAQSDAFGVTLSRSGILLTYSRPNQLRAIRASDGQPLWNVATSSMVQLAPIDEARQTVHLLLQDEAVECRSLKDGMRLWRYEWGGLMPDAERSRLAQQSGRTRNIQSRLPLQFSAYSVGAGGSYLGLVSGHVVHLDPDGHEVWRTRMDSPVDNVLLFDNALLIAQVFLTRPVMGWNDLYPYSLQRPNWQNLKALSGKEGLKLFTRFAALSLEDGQTLSSAEPSVTALSNLCPAGQQLVFGGIRRGSSIRSDTRYVTAYDWVEP